MEKLKLSSRVGDNPFEKVLQCSICDVVFALACRHASRATIETRFFAISSSFVCTCLERFGDTFPLLFGDLFGGPYPGMEEGILPSAPVPVSRVMAMALLPTLALATCLTKTHEKAL